MTRRLGLLAAAVAALALGAGESRAQSDTLGRTTVQQTIGGAPKAPGTFAGLSPAPGEPYLVREEGLGTAHSGRAGRRRSLVYFAQLTDFQLSDEESPARVEFLDSSADEPLNSPFGSAWRPQEALLAHMTEESIRQVDAFERSPVAQGGGARSRMRFAITTGDSADSQQRNETQAVISLLEGGTVRTNSGSSEPADYARCPPGTPGPDEAARYTGVQDFDDGLAGSSYYDPDQPAGQFGAFPRYPGLMDRAQAPFEATGLRVPSYVAFGNHDALVQGNQAATGGVEDVATGCVKLFAPVPGLDPLSAAATPELVLGSVPPKAGLVPPDPARQYVSKAQYKALHATGRQADAHGFGLVAQSELTASRGAAGYYAWGPAPGFRFIALDTVSEGGIAGPSANGNIDDPQFRWLRTQLDRAQDRGELIVVFGHHPIRSLTSTVSDESAPPCSAPDEHGHDRNPGCDLDPRPSTPIHSGADLEALLKATPNVIALVAGHTHENRVTPVQRAGGGGFWTIETAAEIDYPHQNRLLEVMDNRDGTLSIFGTVLDNAAPVATPPPGTSAAAFGVDELASIGRALGYNDPQSAAPNGEAGAGGMGRPQDRNVELLLADPRVVAQGGSGGGGGGGSGGSGGGGSGGGDPRGRSGAGTGGSGVGGGAGEATTSRELGAPAGGTLPFTGLALGTLAMAGAAALALGAALRRRAG